VERINFDFKALRELPIVELLQTLWQKIMTVRLSAINPTEGRIAENTPYGTRYHQVNLQAKSCTCYKYQQNDIPCMHAFALILRLNYLFPLVFLPQICSVQTWQNTYSSNFHPIVFGPHIPLPEPQRKNLHAMPLALAYLGDELRRSAIDVVKLASMPQEFKIYMRSAWSQLTHMSSFHTQCYLGTLVD